MDTWNNGKIKKLVPGDGNRPGARVWIPTLGEILFMPPGELRLLDLGFRNLLCATGLPDTADLDIHACIDKLRQWVEHVKAQTERNLPCFVREPGRYRHSEAFFRAAMLITVLQQDCGVHYDPESIKTTKFLKSSEGFIHGLLRGEGGTCANMPVLYAGIGRKLGYPIYLCWAKGHVFCRWLSADGRERFNIEATGEGLSSFTDDYYMTWPKRISSQDVRLGHYLRNWDPAEEVAHFMTIRGHCLQDRGELVDAIVAYAHAHRLAPAGPHHFATLMTAMCEELKGHNSGKLPNSYREWEDFHKIGRPKQMRDVLKDDFPRIDKNRPPFRPTVSIVAN